MEKINNNRFLVANILVDKDTYHSMLESDASRWDPNLKIDPEKRSFGDWMCPLLVNQN